MAKFKKWFSAMLVWALAFAIIPAPDAFAVGEGHLELGHAEVAELDREMSVADLGPTRSEGNHVRWIDRIAHLPEYAQTFYHWLEDNDDMNGVLVDPTRGEYVDGGYYYLIDSVTKTVNFTYTDNKATSAQAAVRSHADNTFDVMMDYCVDAYSAFDRDHPEVFWLDGSSSYTWQLSYSYSGSNGAGSAKYTMEVYFFLQAEGFDIRDLKYQDAQTIVDTYNQMETDIARILSDCPSDAPVDEQLRYFNRVLTQTNCYNLSAVNRPGSMDPWKCVSALRGSADAEGPVCEGYSRAMKVLCDRMQIPCVLVEGYAISNVHDNPGAHMWNYVQVEGQWYAVDVTWNDPVSNWGEDKPNSGYECEDWFLLGSDTLVSQGLTFLQSHEMQNIVTPGGLDFSNGPVLAKQQYTRAENYMDIAPYRVGTYTAPVKPGYVFAGWYADAAFTVPVESGAVNGWAYAKFVDEKVLSVKYQITKGTNAESASTNLRLLTSVDGLDYSSVSFWVEVGGRVQEYTTQTVYSSILADGQAIRDAYKVFGQNSKYFMTHSIQGVPRGAFDVEILVTPSWTTLDGTTVEGISRSIILSNGF